MEQSSSYKILAGCFDQLSRVAVPFFFIAAGFFFSEDNVQKAKLSIKKLSIIFAFWSLIYIFFPTEYLFNVNYIDAVSDKLIQFLNEPLKILFEGGRSHLWFLSSLILLYIVLARVNYRKALIFGALLYVIGCVFGSYSKPILGFEFISSVNTRNGLFLSSICWALGRWFQKVYKENNNIYTRLKKYSFVIFGLGMVGHFAEIFGLNYYFSVSLIRHDYVLSTVFYAFGLFLFTFKLTDELDGSLIQQLTSKIVPYTLGIYLIHPFIIDVFNNIVVPHLPTAILPVWQIAYVFIVFILSIILIKTASYSQILKKVIQ